MIVTSNPSTFGGPDVATLIGADTFYNNGITGQGTISSNIEAGHVWNGHQALTHVSSFTNSGSAPNNNFTTIAFDRHATWVGHAIGGRGVSSVQNGIAPHTDLRSGAIATQWNGNAYAGSFSASSTSTAIPYAAAFGTSDVINSSWGASAQTPGGTTAAGTDSR
ncbi:MAG: hypothetical protein AAF978_10840, partial [Cyanobacteria bacterium P01_E01_bin.48]